MFLSNYKTNRMEKRNKVEVEYLPNVRRDSGILADV